VWSLDLFSGLTDLVEFIRVDPCAGIEPGTPTPEDCPEGYPATFDFALRTPPPPLLSFGRGHYLTAAFPNGRACPADTPAPDAGQAAVTLFSRTPLASAEIRYRRYGSSDEWQTLAVPPTSDDHVAWWMERFETIEYALEWGTLPICVNVPRDPAFAYELDSSGVDIFDQVVDGYSGIIPLDDPTERPPTRGEVVGLSSQAVVTAYSVDGGMATMRSRAVTGPEDDLSCGRGEEVEVQRAAPSVPAPVGIYDPDYRQPWVGRIPVPPGGQLVVCTDIFPTDNRLRPLATDRLLLSAPTQERPRIVLQGIRRLGDATIQPGLVIAAGFDDDRCAGFHRTTEPIPPGRAQSVEQTIWECATTPLPVDRSGAVDVPVRVTRRVGAGASAQTREEELAIPIRLQPCFDPGGCDRPREWYEIPIPTADSRLCGSGFGSGGCGELEPDGIAVIRVDYPVIAGSSDPTAPSRGTATLLDQVDATVADGFRFSIEAVDFSPSPAGDPLDHDARLRLITDRPVRLEMSPVGWMPPGEEVPPGCGDPTPVQGGELADTFVLEMTGFCAGVGYRFPFRASDEAGNVYEIDPFEAFWTPTVGAPMEVRVDLLGGPDTPNYGFIYRFGVSLDGQNPTAYWWDWTGSRGAAEGCLGLSGTTARSRGARPQVIYLRPTELTVQVRMTITTTGDTDCSGRSQTGLGELTFDGTFTREQLFSDEPLVLETGPDVPVPMRVTVTRVGDWRAAS
jgi:hypothetical protein